jgi:hypothetical protein
MFHDFFRDARVFDFLLRADQDLADRTKAGGCCWCGGQLDCAPFPRKPRGGLIPLGEEFCWRFSFCCNREGCRRRSTPPSVRFFGRRFYLAVVVVLVTAMRQGPTPPGAKKLKEELDVDRRTLSRWQQWWQELFPQGEFWAQARRQLLPRCVAADSLPRSLLEDVFVGGDPTEDLVRCLRFLSPATTQLEVSVHARLWPN